MRRFVQTAIALVAVWLAAAPAHGQGLPIARPECEAMAGQMRGVVDVSLLIYGGAAGLGGGMDRQMIKFLILEGRANELPGLVSFQGLFNDRGMRMDFHVNLTGVTFGTGKYWYNGMEHRGTIFRLDLQRNGFLARDEDGRVVPFSCK